MNFISCRECERNQDLFLISAVCTVNRDFRERENRRSANAVSGSEAARSELRSLDRIEVQNIRVCRMLSLTHGLRGLGLLPHATRSPILFFRPDRDPEGRYVNPEYMLGAGQLGS